MIEINNLTKQYQLGQLQSIKETAQNALNRLRGQKVVKNKRFKALEDINLKIERGEVVGLIGTNGAGKSTLLKIISGISVPTSGTAKVAGTIAPLIEVGAGLHPELTGRENIYLNGSILGIPRGKIKEKIRDIVEFAELEEFIDTPVKRYSSGMMIRLGFSIATSVEADILIVDEVLAVGDLAFQRKCFDRMEEIIGQKDRTVLIVSHNIRQVERICSRAILLETGQVVKDGDTKDVTELFYRRSNEKILRQQKDMIAARKVEQKSGEIDLEDVIIVNGQGESVEGITSGDELRIRVRFLAKRKIPQAEIVVGTHRTDFVYLTAASTYELDDRPDIEEGVNEVECVISTFPFVGGVYCIRFCVLDCNRRLIYNGESLSVFFVETLSGDIYKPSLRTVDLPSKWNFFK